MGAVATYTFTDVQANHTIAASFVVKTYTITATAGPGGTITPSGTVAVACGADQGFAIAPAAGFGILDVVVDGSSVGPLASYTFTGVAANHTIHASFVDTQCPSVTVVAPNGGETLFVTLNVDLTWTATDNVGVTCVDLLLSRTGAAGPYTPIASCIPNSGSYAWPVSGPPTNAAVLKVVGHDAAGNACEDLSDAEFRILDYPVPVLLAQFQANPLDGGVELRWQLNDVVPFVRTEIERSETIQGPYAKLDEAVHAEGQEYVLLDRTAEAGRTYWYRLNGLTGGGQVVTFPPLSTTAGMPITEFALPAISPNPTRDLARISFAVPRSSHVRVTVVDVQGRQVATLIDRNFNVGRYQVTWNGESERGRVASGIYFIRLEAPGKNLVQRVVFMH